MNVDTSEIDALVVRLRATAAGLRTGGARGLLKRVGEGVTMQTKVRITSDKTDPQGRPWRPWSPAYARTRGPQHSLLMDTWAMRDKISSYVHGNVVTIFSDRPYAGFHQTGTARMPARPFLGLSDEDISDVEQWLEGAILAPLTRAA